MTFPRPPFISISLDRRDWSVQDCGRSDSPHHQGQQGSVQENRPSHGHVREGGDRHAVGRGSEYLTQLPWRSRWDAGVRQKLASFSHPPFQ